MKTQFGIWTASIAAMGLIGCNNVPTSVVIEGIAAPSGGTGCLFDPTGDDFRLETVLNTNQQPPPGAPPPPRQLSLTLVARVLNNLQGEETIVELQPEETIVRPTAVQAVRFDFRWECEATGFTQDLGPFILPQFDLNQPFCLTDRDETGNFVGFDAVAASGPAVPARDRGNVVFQPIPPQLGLAFDEFFQVATLANACCDEVGGDCNNVTNANTMGTNPCALLQDLFNGISGGVLNANVPADVQRFQPYSVYDGSAAPQIDFATFELRMRGRFEFVTSAGDMVESSELLHSVRICRSCGFPTSTCTE